MDDVKHARNCASELPWLECNCDGKAMECLEVVAVRRAVEEVPMSGLTDRLREIASEATPGPWHRTSFEGGTDDGIDGATGERVVCPTISNETIGVDSELDAEHIATFDPVLVAAMLDVIDAAEDVHQDGFDRQGNLETALARFREVAECGKAKISDGYVDAIGSLFAHGLYPSLVAAHFGDEGLATHLALHTPFPYSAWLPVVGRLREYGMTDEQIKVTANTGLPPDVLLSIAAMATDR